jgi:hypothetical protein
MVVKNFLNLIFLHIFQSRRGLLAAMFTGYAASHAADAELQGEGILPPSLTVRATRYLNQTDVDTKYERIMDPTGAGGSDHGIDTSGRNE